MKKNTWNIRRLVDESFGPATQQPSVLYWILSNFRIGRRNNKFARGHEAAQGVWYCLLITSTFICMGCIWSHSLTHKPNVWLFLGIFTSKQMVLVTLFLFMLRIQNKNPWKFCICNFLKNDVIVHALLQPPFFTPFFWPKTFL